MILSGIKNSSIIILKNRFSTIYLKLFLLSFLLIWVFGLLQPILLPSKNVLTSYFLDRIYSSVCHQEGIKCITIGVDGMLVCARCAGIYFGALITVALLLFRRIPQINIKVFLISILPLLLDVLLSTIRIYSYSKHLAFATGLIFGSLIGLFLLSEIENLFSNKSINRNE